VRKRSKRIIIILVVILIFVATATLTLGKYAYNNAWNYYLSSKGFYFESDFLDINTKKNSLLKWDGSNINFEIKNSQNDKLISEYDISYKITCEVLGEESNYIKCNLNGTNTSVFSGALATTSKCVNSKDDIDVDTFSKAECEVGGYTWNEEVISKSNYFNLELSDPTKSIDEVSVKITAESLMPYHQTLTGIFNINKVDGVDLEIVTSYQEYQEYNEMSVTNTTTNDKCVTINFDSSKYSIDLNDSSILEYSVDTNEKINLIKMKINKESSGTYKFYKIINDEIYSINDFSVEEKEC
jgi:hypothetical protein